MRIAAIDPGMTGAIALLDEHGDLITVTDMPTLEGRVSGGMLADELGDMQPEVVVIERVAAFPKNGTIANFKLGMNYGIAYGVAAALNLSVYEYTPSVWKRKMGLTGKGKDASRSLAMETWPHRRAWFARKRDDGRAEAALLGLMHLREWEWPDRRLASVAAPIAAE